MIQQTSIMAYHSIPNCENLYNAILGTLENYPNGLTDGEIILLIGNEWSKLQPRARRNELVKKGYVFESFKRNCTVTHKKVLTWKLK